MPCRMEVCISACTHLQQRHHSPFVDDHQPRFGHHRCISTICLSHGGATSHGMLLRLLHLGGATRDGRGGCVCDGARRRRMSEGISSKALRVRGFCTCLPVAVTLPTWGQCGGTNSISKTLRQPAVVPKTMEGKVGAPKNSDTTGHYVATCYELLRF
eukprot:1148208-Pelagomonas_calceolata.AAC.14